MSKSRENTVHSLVCIHAIFHTPDCPVCRHCVSVCYASAYSKAHYFLNSEPSSISLNVEWKRAHARTRSKEAVSNLIEAVSPKMPGRRFKPCVCVPTICSNRSSGILASTLPSPYDTLSPPRIILTSLSPLINRKYVKSYTHWCQWFRSYRSSRRPCRAH
jgi:hypothetical protein